MAAILGVDFGEKRVGLAIGDDAGLLAVPLRTVEVGSVAGAVEAVALAARESGAQKVVVGLPVNMNGTVGTMAERVKAFCVKLREKAGLVVETWDERLSTAQVERVMLAADLSRARRRSLRDKLAAQVILQSYLDAHAPPQEPFDPEETGL